ncbi:Phytochrome, two-component sensor histidine kinase [Enhygromyxa salina]|uniref:histidine kinase n=1 Tax=Enhygromyxa salina TaxID=215803 RepID=A0A0C2CWW8_9BACT|nr:PAS domain-containing protein [Enhygromyxa salina]KIG15526.1 Phytochrome, two-component sensor histidine kinase [Enhygromyxa salina]
MTIVDYSVEQATKVAGPDPTRGDLHAALRADARALDFVLDAGGDGLAYWDWARERVWLSPSLCAALQTPRDTDAEHIPMPDRRAIERMLDHYRAQDRDTASHYEGGLRWQRSDGTVLRTRDQCVIVRGDGVNPSGLLCTHQVQASGTVQFGDSDSLSQILESLPQFVWTCRPDGVCDYLSPQWVRYTGTPAHLQLGWNWLEQVHPDDREQTQASWQAAVEGQGAYTQEFRLRASDGRYRWFSTRAVPIFDGHGQLVKWLGSNTDIQELRDAQDRLAQINGELEARVLERTTALQEANAQLEIAQRISHIGSWSYCPATGEVEWSDELFRILGRSPGAPIPSVAEQRKAFPPDSLARLDQALDHTHATGEDYELEVELIRPDDERRVAISRGRRVLDANGLRILVGTFQDVSDLVYAQRDRDLSAERLRMATSAARMGVWDWDIRRDQLTWDEQMHALYGRLPGRDPGSYETWAAALHPSDRAASEAAVKAAIEGSGEFDTGFRVVGPGDEIRHIHSVGKVFYDEHGEPYRMLGVNRDMSAKREAELALLANKRLLEQFVRYVPAAIAMVDTELRYIQASARWIRDYQLDEDNLIGRSHYEIFPETPARWKQVHQRALRGAIESSTDDPFPRADGSMDWLHWEVRPWHRPDGEIGGLLFFTQVTTQRKRMEMLLQRQRDDLERSNRDLEHFAYAASHDLQEPLRAVAGCAQILQHKYHDALDESANSLIGHIVDGADRMRILITDLLTYSRVSSHGADFGYVDTNAALGQALTNLDSGIAETGARVQYGALPPVSGDATQLSQLFQNLIGNALKYRSDAPPRVEISAKQDKDDWLFCVRDNGIGIERDYFDRVFVLFQRLHTRAEYPGTGIGLALCKKIVERHDGRIWVESTVGQGTSFYFTLPASPCAERGEHP